MGERSDVTGRVEVADSPTQPNVRRRAEGSKAQGGYRIGFLSGWDRTIFFFAFLVG